MRRVGMFVFVLALLFGSVESRAAERYGAMFSDGGRAEEAEVREWCEPTSQAKIGGRILFDANTPVRWIIDRTQTRISKPPRYVELVGGDRVAGEVISISDGLENPYEFRPQHFVIKPAMEVQPPDAIFQANLRVTTEWVQRVVWERVAPDEYHPGTAWTRTGKSIAFRSLRWSALSATLLTSDGVKEISISDLAEVHLPKLNPWISYYEQLAFLAPDTNGCLIQMDAIDGSRFTTSLERFQSRHHGDRNRPEHWYQLIQPAWSLDSIWVRYRTLCAWRVFPPNEVPLSNFSPVQAKNHAVFGTGWDWQVNENAQHGPLQSLDREFGWGFGVFGSSELSFELPEIAQAVRTQYGLDRTAGSGGCVNVEVLDGIGKSLKKHSNLIGASFVGSTDWLGINAISSSDRRMTFRTEMAHESRPAGADPFDVRDISNWYEPEVRLDQAALENEVRSRGPTRLAGLIGWNLSTGNSQSMKVVNVLDAYDTRDPQFRRVVRSTDRFYILSRKIKVGPLDRWLGVIASRFAENTSPTGMQVRVEGRVLGEFDIPIRNSMTDPEPMLVSVSQFQGRTVTVEAVVYPTDEKSWVDWRGVSIGPERPGLLTIFEDDENFATLLNGVNGNVSTDTEKPYSGKRSLKVPANAVVENASLPKLDALVCESPQIGQYRFVVFAWKKPVGTRVQIQFANQGRLGENRPLPGGDQNSLINRRGLRRTQNIDERGQRYAYCYEQGVVSSQIPLPVFLNGELPRDWQLVQRDMFGEFGLLAVTGFALKNVDGEAAWFDHIYLARTHEDLQYATTYLVNPQPNPPQSNEAGHLWIARREDYPAEFSRVAPLFSTLDMPHGLIRQTEQNGQADVLRTHANDRDKPLVLRAGVILPKDRPMLLDLHVSHHPQFDWQLVVRANGEVLTDQLINEKLTAPQRGWATVQVDLSKFAGQNVLLEVLNKSNNWENEIAYWKRIELIEK